MKTYCLFFTAKANAYYNILGKLKWFCRLLYLWVMMTVYLSLKVDILAMVCNQWLDSNRLFLELNN